MPAYSRSRTPTDAVTPSPSPPAVGPVYASWIALKLSWRWIFWVQMMVCGASFVCFCLFLREPRASTLLSKRARKLTKETGVEHRTVFDDEKVSFKQVAAVSLARPMKYLCTEP